MKPRLVPLALCAMLAATVAGAQSRAAQSQIARSVLPDLRRAGVSAECIAKLSTHDFVLIKGALEAPGESGGNKRLKAKFAAERGCGETRSFIFEIFR